MKIFKKILTGLAVALVIIQFIRPGRNNGNAYSSNDITHAIDVPDEVRIVLDKACNDCHSDYTNYDGLWYMNIQPIGWWINHHIEEGKHHLNFSVFNTYSLKRKAHKLEEVAEQVEYGEMPMGSYSRIHKEAKLTDAEKKLLVDWAMKNHKELKAKVAEGK